MKIFDCFIYNGEDELLDIRLNELDSYVSYFVLVESNISFSGIKKSYSFNSNKFKKFKHKIRYVPVQDGQAKYQNKNYWPFFKAVQWQREFFCRNSILDGLYDAQDEDYVLLSDIDELPNLENLSFDTEIIIFKQICLQFKLNLMNPGLTPYFGTKGIKFRSLGIPSELRLFDQEHLGIVNYQGLNKKYVKDGGWHFSYCTGTQDILKKIRFYSHFERAKSINLEHIDNCIKNRKDLWNGEFNYVKKTKNLEIKNNEFLPKYVQQNMQKFKHLLA
jgi:beta-1,4-mannosyl-glycoprotein beta-1,4-N-acetylglucosaminyltransferase